MSDLKVVVKVFRIEKFMKRQGIMRCEKCFKRLRVGDLAVSEVSKVSNKAYYHAGCFPERFKPTDRNQLDFDFVESECKNVDVKFQE